MFKLPNIALGCEARVGKDTVADYLHNKYNYKIIRIATPLYDCTSAIQNILGFEVKKDGKLLQDMGTLLKSHYDDDVFVNKLDKELADETQAYVVVDVRHKNEYNYLSKKGFKMIRIKRKVDLNDNRDKNHKSECDLLNTNFDYVIKNKGSLVELNEKIELALVDIIVDTL